MRRWSRILIRHQTPKKPELDQKSKLFSHGFLPFSFFHHRLYKSTRYPYQYEMITSTPLLPPRHRPPKHPPPSDPKAEASEPLDLGHWMDQKFSMEQGRLEGIAMEKSKRRYYMKRMKRMHGGDWSEDDKRTKKGKDEYVELIPEIVEFRSLHEREEELYFYDAFQYPWEKGRHYKMVYLLEKKFFPNQCMDKAFVDPMKWGGRKGSGNSKEESLNKGYDDDDDRRLMFFEEEGGGGGGGCLKDEKPPVLEKKIEKFFKGLRKVPVRKEEGEGEEPYVVTRSSELPPRWDCPRGCVVLVNKPKGWSSFTVCGKLRRLVNGQKIGHTGTLDPLATGLLIVCFGNATKLVEKYQDMMKGYSGVLRLGEATSTLDADSPVIQREPWEHIKDRDVRKAAASFCGDILQVPPMFSAIKAEFDFQSELL